MKFIIFSLLNLIVFSTYAQSHLWQISNDSTTLYLGGSIHLLRASDYPLPLQYDSAFNKSDVLVTETNIKELEKPEIMQLMMSSFVYTNGKSLNSVLTEKPYNKLKDECLKNGFELEKMNQFKPSLPVLTLTMIKLKQLGITEEGVDKFYLNKAIKQNKKLEYLESIESQINLIANMGETQEDAFVGYSLKDINHIEKMLLTLIDEWKTGSTKSINKDINELKSEYPKLYNQILSDRNKAWLPKIEDYLTNSKTEFIIVGALHLYGEDGLLTLLKNKGYTVKQL